MKKFLSVLLAVVFSLNMTVFADFVKIDSQNQVYYEMYDFSSDVHGTALTRAPAANGVNSGFVLENTGSGASVYNDGTDAYISYFASDNNSGVNRLAKTFENTYSGSEVTLVLKLRTNDSENTGKRIRIYDSDGSDFTVRMPVDADSGSYITTGNYYLTPFAYNDNRWHEFKFVFDFTNKLCNMYFDGVGISQNNTANFNLPLADNFTDIKRIGICADVKGRRLELDDVQISNVASAIPPVVNYTSGDDMTVSLSCEEGNTIKYAVGATSAEALSSLSEATVYTDKITVTEDKPYVAAYSVDDVYGTEGLRTYYKYVDKNIASLNVLKHISPYNVLTTGGVSNTDSLQLGVANNEIKYSGTISNIQNAFDSIFDDNANNFATAETDEYIDFDFSSFKGTKTINDIKIVFGKIDNNASYNFELLYKKNGEDGFIKFYESEYTDSTTYSNPVYPTEVLTEFGEQISDVEILRVKFNKPCTIYEIDLNTLADSEEVNTLRDGILSKISIAKLFSDNAIIQRDKEIKIHGYGGKENGQIKVQIIKDSDNSILREKTVTSSNYKWNVTFDAIEGGMDTYTIKVADTTDDANYAQSTGILFGDVFVGSGQSNMEMTINTTVNSLTAIATQQSIAEAERVKTEMDTNAYTGVRIMNQSNTITALQPLDEAYTANWVICDNFDDAKGVSAVAYFFAKELYEELGKEIPIGVMLARRGGTKVKCWIPEDHFDEAIYGDSNKELTDYNRSNYLSYRVWTGGYNALVAPLTATNIKGVIWYQGEDDTDIVQGYKNQFKDLVAGWRDKFNNPSLSFNVVQLAAYSNSPNNWPNFRQTQMQLWLNDEYNTMVNAIDIGESMDIHPGYKAPLGRRLALAAMSKLYNSKDEYSGPLFYSLEKNNNTLVAKFTNADGMKAKNRTPYTENFSDADKLTGFEISSDGQTWVEADASVLGDTVIVSGVENPVAVRYAWANYPTNNPNLYNSSNLPAFPFMASINDISVSPSVIIGTDMVSVTGKVIDKQLLKNDAKAIITMIKDGVIKSVKTEKIATVLNEQAEYSFDLPIEDADEVKVIIVDSFKNLRPLSKKGTN